MNHRATGPSRLFSCHWRFPSLPHLLQPAVSFRCKRSEVESQSLRDLENPRRRQLHPGSDLPDTEICPGQPDQLAIFLHRPDHHDCAFFIFAPISTICGPPRNSQAVRLQASSHSRRSILSPGFEQRCSLGNKLKCRYRHTRMRKGSARPRMLTSNCSITAASGCTA